MVGKVAPAADREVVDSAHGATVGQQAVHQMAADEATTTCDYVHGSNLLSVAPSGKRQGACALDEVQQGNPAELGEHSK